MGAHHVSGTLDPYDELCAWTLSLGDPEFIHQHVVDAHMLQNATLETKPVGIAFALVGLYLFLERGFTGREVQLAHMKLGKVGGPWPTFDLPPSRGALTQADALAAPAGDDRVAAIREWCAAAWAPWSSQRAEVLAFLQAYQIVP
jgi:hypothetical protein